MVLEESQFGLRVHSDFQGDIFDFLTKMKSFIYEKVPHSGFAHVANSFYGLMQCFISRHCYLEVQNMSGGNGNL